MTPIQQLMLGVGASKKTYLDDIFSTYVYKGPVTNNRIYNNIDLAGKGGLVWIKHRDTINNLSEGHFLFDTVRGATKQINAHSNSAESTISSDVFNTFNSDGFTVGGHSRTGGSGQKFGSFSFRKASGFFDIVTYTGNGTSGRTVNHSLGCVPGCIIIKRIDGSAHWAVFHRDIDDDDFANYSLSLNETNARWASSTIFNDTKPSSTQFTLGNNERVNTNGSEYVAYLFAGGESTGATARSVDFDASHDFMYSGSSSDYTMGTGDFTVECWAKTNNRTRNHGLFQISSSATGVTGTNYQNTIAVGKTDIVGGGSPAYTWTVYGGNGNSTAPAVTYENTGQWTHIALVRSSAVTTLYANGIKQVSFSDTTDYDGTTVAIGAYYASDYSWDGQISNFRVLKGTALYTSSFRPPTEALTSITNTKLLCCNNSSTTGSTTTAATITTSGTVTASTDSPFDDPSGFVFGENGDQNVIKCGSYIGNGSATGPEINLGFEPSWLLIKSATEAGENWAIFDSMRDVLSGGDDKYFYITGTAENTYDLIELTPTGFKCVRDDGTTNRDGETFVFCAIRRADGYVGKPAEAGTDVFTMDTGASSSTIPNYDSGFPVDFGINKIVGGAYDWGASSRLTSGKYLIPNKNDAEGSSASFVFDSNVGWNTDGNSSTKQSWMWKRHAGFDVVTYEGDGVAGKQIPHSLAKTPEMVWVKQRSAASSWVVWHKGLNGGTNSYNYHILLDTNGSEVDDGSAGTQKFHSATPPTSTMVSVGGSGWTNADDSDHIMMLFASVDGISKVGYYDGSASEQTITTGFQPRFAIIKRINTTGNWIVLDTTRGWGSGNDEYLFLDGDDAQLDTDMGAPTSTGFTVSTHGFVNGSGNKFIYYAHA